MEEKKKRIESQRVKPRTAMPAINVLIGKVEQNKNTRKEKDKNREQAPNLDHSLASYGPQGSHY